MACSKVRPIYPVDNYVIIAAIDFGTTFSGYAFSLKSIPDKIYMNKNWGESMGFTSYKAPTCVLTGPDDDFLCFGYEAENKYAHIESDGKQAKPHHLYRHFKMMLYDEKKITRQTNIKSATGHSRRAMDIFVMALKYLKDHLINAINRSSQYSNLEAFATTSANASLIKWVITVPAIWNDDAKQFMREAAFKANLINSQESRQLIIALEPEVASIYCRSLDVQHFVQGEQDNQSAEFEVGTVYMVIDAGGGTVDVTVHEVLPDDQVKEIHTATGGNWGGEKVDGYFSHLLGKILGEDFISTYKRECPQQWFTLMTNFEKVKKSAKPDASSKITLSLPWSMGKKYQEVKGSGIEVVFKRASHLGITFANGAFVLNQDAVVDLFQHVVNEIVEHTEHLLHLPNVQNCKYILLVGGFGESAFLHNAIERRFGDKIRLLVPYEAQMSVIKGAVLFGHRPMSIKSRISKRTYGVEISTTFDDKLHDKSYMVMRDGRCKCEHLFDPYAQIGEEIDTGTKKAVEYYPTEKDQIKMSINLYATDKIVEKGSATYTTHSSMECLGKFIVDMPDTLGGYKRKVKLDIEFGGTEIHINGTDLTTGNTAGTSIDFLTE